jgi:hypothetical protein
MQPTLVIRAAKPTQPQHHMQPTVVLPHQQGSSTATISPPPDQPQLQQQSTVNFLEEQPVIPVVAGSGHQLAMVVAAFNKQQLAPSSRSSMCHLAVLSSSSRSTAAAVSPRVTGLGTFHQQWFPGAMALPSHPATEFNRVQLRKVSRGRQSAVMVIDRQSQHQQQPGVAAEEFAATSEDLPISGMQHSLVAVTVGAPYSGAVLSQQPSPKPAVCCSSSGNNTVAATPQCSNVICVAEEAEPQELARAEPGADADVDDAADGTTYYASGQMLRAGVQMNGGCHTGQQTYPCPSSIAAVIVEQRICLHR